jgi:hypothetical protein
MRKYDTGFRSPSDCGAWRLVRQGFAGDARRRREVFRMSRWCKSGRPLWRIHHSSDHLARVKETNASAVNQ